MSLPRDPGPCFHCPDLPGEGDSARLPRDEARHAGAARRIRVGDAIGLIDGRGGLAHAVVEAVDRGTLDFRVHTRHQFEPARPALEVATAVPRGERFRMLLDMLCQLGVAGIMPLVCERSAARPRPASAGRWQRIAMEACKQSRNPWLPRIDEPASVAQSLTRVDDERLVYADAGGSGADDVLAPGGRMRLYVGPEGGFTDDEQELLETHGARPLALGRRVLRTETAAVAAAAVALLTDRRSGS